MTPPVTVADVEHAIAEAFPPEWAEEWDNVGLVVGDPASAVSAVFVTLDATVASIASAVEAGANVLVSHHPATLEKHSVLRPDVTGCRVLFEACSRSVALISAHTNLDRSPEGPVRLARALDLPDGEPLESGTLDECLLTVYVPESSLDAVVEAMDSAGAGRIGMYRGCSFSVRGEGRFEGLTGSAPNVGTAGEPTVSDEVRVELVCPSSRVDAVMSAARRAHPYEEPLIVASDVRVSR
ncbi:MAG: Nif3-like dinuclear metal center hexameric protein, partial [Coriobacteriia bacterium]|nr:Nif3-like dinuclear metal center hexameric protein [Coriobacteriia bacterium]